MVIELNEVVAEQLAPKVEMSKEDWEKYLSIPSPVDNEHVTDNGDKTVS